MRKHAVVQVLSNHQCGQKAQINSFRGSNTENLLKDRNFIKESQILAIKVANLQASLIRLQNPKKRTEGLTWLKIRYI